MPTQSLELLQRVLADRYRLEREVGRGGMAIVYLAEDRKHHRRVAIKVLKPELAQALGGERFLREIEIAAGLTHPHILPLHDSGDADGLLYYVMPYVEGESLRARLDRERQLPVDDALRVAGEVAGALAYAHAHGVIHRDVKPENILFQAGQAVVSDFGVARAVGEAGGDKLTEAGLAVGTPAYMSPEQGSGEQQLDARTDVYSLGCVVYEMLAGEPPYTGATPQAVLARKAVEPVPGLRVVRETVPAAVEAVVAKALARVPADRFATAAQFKEALDRAPTAGDLPGARPRRRTHPWARATAVAALLSVGLAGGGWWGWRALSGVGAARVESLAVLPFDNLSGPEQEYFVAGMHDALIGELAQIGALRVISRTSTMRYRNSGKSVSEIARELKVDGIVEGSVVRAGDSVRIQVQLIQASPKERHLWTRAYDRDLRHVLALHGDVARAIAREVRVTLTPAEVTRLTGARPVNPEAYQAYLKGMFHWSSLTPPELEAAEQYFELALRKDSNYAPAYSGIALVWVGRQQMGFVPSREAAPRARAAVHKALALDSTLARAHAVLASVEAWSDWNWADAERSFRRAIELDPSDVITRAAYSHFLNIMGRPEEAMPQIGRALELDPFNAFLRAMYGVDLMFVRRNDDAITQFRQALNSSPGPPLVQFPLAIALHMKGMYRESLAEAQAWAAALADHELRAALTQGYAEAGYAGAMRRAADTLAARSRTSYVPGLDVASLYLRAGEKDRALDWLERAYEAGDPNVPYIRMPEFEPLGDDPRFRELLRRMGFPN